MHTSTKKLSFGVVLQDSEPEPGLSVRECLRLYAGYYRGPRDVDDTIALVGLTAKAGTLAAQLSGGQRRRLDAALALIGDPEVDLPEPFGPRKPVTSPGRTSKVRSSAASVSR